ncbi:kinocilin [Erpetoichthys calabaricus]|uniref:kinocilin n=1 Tax=Erpetoichthys calabaricus TaxID=27687 RepID=UPI0010A0AEA0|nr:kinocilin [Erpetoichthys calabaricus]
MNAVSTNEFHLLRVSCAVLSIVAGCIIIGVSNYCGAEAVGGIFLGAGGLGLIISIYPFVRAWLNFNQVLPFLGNFRIHPRPNNSEIEIGGDAFKREGTQANLTRELTRNKIGPMQEKQAMDMPEEGHPSDTPDIIGKRKFKQPTVDLNTP